MSILSDRDIRRALDSGAIRVTDLSGLDWDALPEEPWRIQPASFEMTLGGADDSLQGYGREMVSFVGNQVQNNVVIDPERPPAMVRKSWWIHEPTGRRYYMLQPGEFLLGSTAERLTLGRSLCAALEGKSSLGRMGLMVHATARFIDPGWDGRLTLEFVNASPRPIRLWAGMRIGQIRFERLSSPSERLYGDESLGSHYQGSEGTVQPASVAYVGPEIMPPAYEFREALPFGETRPLRDDAVA